MKINGTDTRGCKHSPTIENEVCESLFANLAGAMANLTYTEEKNANPDKNKITFFMNIGKALWKIKRKWYSYTDEYIQQISKPVSLIINELGNANTYDEKLTIVEINRQYFEDLIINNL